MTNQFQSLKLILIAGLGSFALTACVPGQYAYDSAEYSATSGQYDAGYSQSGYSQNNVGFTQSRYGDTINASLRPPCQVQASPCGYTTVVPVYPIYQIPIAPEPVPEPVVEIFEPPVVEIFEPEPTVIVEPEPIYTPMEHWPEPSTPIESWKPIRK